MNIGITYDLREEYLLQGYTEEETAEFDSPVTIDAIESTLEELGFTTERVGSVYSLINQLAAGKKFHMVFNIAEGMYGIGREAQVPAILDAYRIPYTFSDPCVLALTLNKYMTKRVIRDMGLSTPDFTLVTSADDSMDISLQYPLFCKPYSEGTGKGITASSLVHNHNQLIDVCRNLLTTFHQPVLVERYLPGREFTVGITGTGSDAVVIGAMEILLLDSAESNAYTYSNKKLYTERVRYRRVNDITALRAADLALAAWRGLGCNDGGRIDLRCDENGDPAFIEVNTLAGLHPHHSDLPIICGQNGISYKELIAMIMRSAIKRYHLEKKAPVSLIDEQHLTGSRA